MILTSYSAVVMHYNVMYYNVTHIREFDLQSPNSIKENNRMVNFYFYPSNNN